MRPGRTMRPARSISSGSGRQRRRASAVQPTLGRRWTELVQGALARRALGGRTAYQRRRAASVEHRIGNWVGGAFLLLRPGGKDEGEYERRSLEGDRGGAGTEVRRSRTRA